MFLLPPNTEQFMQSLLALVASPAINQYINNNASQSLIALRLNVSYKTGLALRQTSNFQNVQINRRKIDGLSFTSLTLLLNYRLS